MSSLKVYPPGGSPARTTTDGPATTAGFYHHREEPLAASDSKLPRQTSAPIKGDEPVKVVPKALPFVGIPREIIPPPEPKKEGPGLLQKIADSVYIGPVVGGGCDGHTRETQEMNA